MLQRSRALWSLVHRASQHGGASCSLPLSSNSSRSTLWTQLSLQRRFFGHNEQKLNDLKIPSDPEAQYQLLRQLNHSVPKSGEYSLFDNNQPARAKVIELFETGRVLNTTKNLCEYVKALSALDKLDAGLVAATMQRGAAATWQSSTMKQARREFYGNEQTGTIGTERNPMYMRQVERSFWEQLWASFRWFLVSIILVAGLIVYADDKTGGMARPFLNNPDVKQHTRSDTKFSDVKGVDEAKDELLEVVEYLKHPQKFTALGGKLPKGVLLVGPPGTGKTMLARAIAGEAGVPFYYASGSEFEEMFVGVGARRVRDLFATAKQNAPCIIFIDEIDAVGSSRQPKDQQYQRMTLNQLLVELDGFKSTEGVIVVAATNFPETLDKALIRPGRFDRHVVVPQPDVMGRLAILESAFEKVSKADDVDLEVIARATPGFSGADLANLVNVAAIKAARDGEAGVTMTNMEFAKDRIVMGAERKSAFITEEQRRLTAYHEGGHALVAMLTKGARPVLKATIMPRGNALGMVQQLPEKNETGITRTQLMAMLDVCMGGRVAEELIFGQDNMTTGATSDLSQASRIARAMVTEYGFSDKIGPQRLSYEGNDMSPETKAVVEEEVRRLVSTAYTRAKAVLTRHEDKLHKLATALVENETMSGEQIAELLGVQYSK